MLIPDSRFEVPSALAYQLASTMQGELAARRGIVALGRRALSDALPDAERTATVPVPVLGLPLGVYRVSLLERPYEVVTRPAGGRERVVGIVPADRAHDHEGEYEDEQEYGEVISDHEAALLTLELLGAENEAELDQFLGSVFKAVSNVAKGVTKTVAAVGKKLDKVVDKINKVVPIKSVINTVKKGWEGINKFVPIEAVLSLTPVGMAMRGMKAAGRVLAGENIFKVAGNLVKSGLRDVGKAMQLASTVAAFVPGVGTGVAAALGAAGALAQGQPITEAVLAAAKSALPGGQIAAAAFDVASGLAQGKSLTEAALNAARNQIPGGPAARAAFDAGLALARGKKLQDVALAAAGQALPRSPFTESALNFAQRVAQGASPQEAALTAAGSALLRRAGPPAPPIGVKHEIGRGAWPSAGVAATAI
jgi:hypothetical protein